MLGLEPTQTDASVQPPDLMPTLLDVLGVASPQGMHGESFAPVLSGGKETFRNCVFTSSPLYSPGERTKAVDDWERLIKDPLPSTITTREWTLLYRTEDYPAELYRVSQDPAQSKNLLRERFEVSQDLQDTFIEFLQAINTEERYLSPRRRINRSEFELFFLRSPISLTSSFPARSNRGILSNDSLWGGKCNIGCESLLRGP